MTNPESFGCKRALIGLAPVPKSNPKPVSWQLSLLKVTESRSLGRNCFCILSQICTIVHFICLQTTQSVPFHDLARVKHLDKTGLTITMLNYWGCCDYHFINDPSSLHLRVWCNRSVYLCVGDTSTRPVRKETGVGWDFCCALSTWHVAIYNSPPLPQSFNLLASIKSAINSISIIPCMNSYLWELIKQTLL